MTCDWQTSRGVTFRRPVADEKTEQGSIINLLEMLGGIVHTLGTRRAQYCGLCGGRTTDQGTRQTPGLPDLYVVLPPAPTPYPQPGTPSVALWIEVKGKGGTLSHEQVMFRARSLAADVPVLVGGVAEVVAFLETHGWLKPTEVPR